MSSKPAHGRLSASRAVQFMNCSAAPALSDRYPRAELEDEYRERGTFAHTLAAFALSEGCDICAVPGVEKLEPDEVESLAYFIGFCQSLIRESVQHGTGRYWIEERFEWDACADVTGTVDFAAITEHGSRLTVVDYKHGVGEKVLAFENLQLLQYAFLVLESDKALKVENIDLVIFQPRHYAADRENYKPEIWSVGPFEINRFFALLLASIQRVEAADFIELTEGLDASNTNPGDHCRFCDARGFCPGIYRANVLALIGDQTPSIDFAAPADIEPRHLSYVLDMEDRIRSWLGEVRSFVIAQIQGGSQDFPGYKLVEKLGNRRYRDEIKAEEVLLTELGEGIYDDPPLLSPAQIEKRFKSKGKAILEELELTIRPVSGVSLVRVLNPKEALEFQTADQEFTAIEGGAQ